MFQYSFLLQSCHSNFIDREQSPHAKPKQRFSSIAYQMAQEVWNDWGWLAQPEFNEITAVPLMEAIFLWELSLSSSRSQRSSDEKCSKCVWQAFAIPVISSSPLPNSRIVAIGDFSWTQLLLKWTLIVTLHSSMISWAPDCLYLSPSCLKYLEWVLFSYSESWSNTGIQSLWVGH